MPGRAALLDIAAVRSQVSEINIGSNPAGAGDPVGEYSSIGGEGRKGSDAYGMLSDPSYTRIDAEVVGKGMNGMATGGKLGYNSGDGRTFSGAGRRKED